MSDASQSNPHPSPQQTPRANEQQPVSPRLALMGAAAVAAVALLLVGVGVFGRHHADTVLAKHTDELAPPTVSVAPAKAAAPSETYVLPANVTAFTDAPIYARTDGYLMHWYYDIGARVKKGALLATISTPELDRQVAQAQADLATAQANAGNAKTQAQRYTGLVKSDAVSQQDTDTFTTQAASTASTVRSAQANLARLRELQSFEKVYAPFDGVVTARTIDTGQLINSGTGKELFHLQATQTLRVYTNVPQIYEASIKRGMKVDLTFAEHVGKVYQGTVVRTADAIDPASRTLLVEIDVDNRSGELLPGSLASAHFKKPALGPTYIVPAPALIFRREGLQIATVVDSPKGPVAHLVPVVIGEDDGATVQIVDGLNPSDRIIQDPPDSVIDGERVTVVSPSNPSQTGGK